MRYLPEQSNVINWIQIFPDWFYFMICSLQCSYIIPALFHHLLRRPGREWSVGSVGLCWHAAGCVWLEPTKVKFNCCVLGDTFSLWQACEGWLLVALSMIPHRSTVGSSSGAAQYSTPPEGPVDLLSWAIIFMLGAVTSWCRAVI